MIIEWRRSCDKLEWRSRPLTRKMPSPNIGDKFNNLLHEGNRLEFFTADKSVAKDSRCRIRTTANKE